MSACGDNQVLRLPEYSCIKLDLRKIKGTKLIWRNKLFLPELSDDAFKDAFSYVLPKSEIFSRSIFSNETKAAVGERYGGTGTSFNGGGVRCANYDGYQVKGVGKNKLVGGQADKWHTYGGLSLEQGYIELINTRIFNKILPEGTIDVLGLIHLGKNLAYDFRTVYSDRPERTEDAVLFVRELSLRPAHLLHCRLFSREQEKKANLSSDKYRVKMSITQVIADLGGLNNFVDYLGNFLYRSAKQFAFCYAFRIAHGATSPSNLSLDGRWLDLSNIAFLDGGKTTSNHLIKHHFSMSRIVLQIIWVNFYTP